MVIHFHDCSFQIMDPMTYGAAGINSALLNPPTAPL